MNDEQKGQNTLDSVLFLTFVITQCAPDEDNRAGLAGSVE